MIHPTQRLNSGCRTRRQPLDLPIRAAKPRISGLTAITDNGIPAGELAYILENYHEFIDLAKIGVGAANLEPQLEKKLCLNAEYGIAVYFGGTLFEKFYTQGKLDDYLRWLDALGIGSLEAANGASAIPTNELAALIEKITRRFDVLAEVGKRPTTAFARPTGWKPAVLIARQVARMSSWRAAKRPTSAFTTPRADCSPA